MSKPMQKADLAANREKPKGKQNGWRDSRQIPNNERNNKDSTTATSQDRHRLASPYAHPVFKVNSYRLGVQDQLSSGDNHLNFSKPSNECFNPRSALKPITVAPLLETPLVHSSFYSSRLRRSCSPCTADTVVQQGRRSYSLRAPRCPHRSRLEVPVSAINTSAWSQPKYKASPAPCSVPLPAFVLAPCASQSNNFSGTGRGTLKPTCESKRSSKSKRKRTCLTTQQTTLNINNEAHHPQTLIPDRNSLLGQLLLSNLNPALEQAAPGCGSPILPLTRDDLEKDQDENLSTTASLHSWSSASDNDLHKEAYDSVEANSETGSPQFLAKHTPPPHSSEFSCAGLMTKMSCRQHTRIGLLPPSGQCPPPPSEMTANLKRLIWGLTV
eukprot:GHVN01065990.1.p1 GENE.GHVN01065990.1~~GHVN01065990.1.p1  ORF type:complete len:384 (-),score=42.75 GHVN01065990.1:797-1948(-)